MSKRNLNGNLQNVSKSVDIKYSLIRFHFNFFYDLHVHFTLISAAPEFQGKA